MKLSVVIVNYNVEHFLEQCLYSVRRAMQGIEGEVFVVDNNSVDGSLKMLAAKFPEVKVIANKDNVGFAKANNQAIRISEGEYVLLLNPDTVVEDDTFSKCIAFMDSHPDAGGLGVKMVDGKGQFLPESKRGLPTPMTAFYKIFGLSKLFPHSKRFSKYHLGYLPDDEVNPVDILAGAYMLMRRETLDKCGLLDETFFMYGEDIDLSYRLMKDDDKQNYYLPTRIIHYKGESTNKSTLRYAHVFYEAMLIFLRKHFPVYALLFYIPIQFAILLKAFHSSLKSLWTNIRNYLHPSLMTDNDRFIYIGNHADNVKKIAEIDGIDVDRHEADETTMPEGHLALDYEKYTYVIYDLGAFSRKKVLELMEKTAGKIKLATYDPRNEKIIYHWHNRRG